MRIRLTLALVLLCPMGMSAQIVAAVSGNCDSGNQKPLTQGLASTNTFVASYPLCTVAVYNTGLLTQPTIYANASLGALSNPFTANADGSWVFFANVGFGYDVVMSGGTPISFPSPTTITDVFAGSTYPASPSTSVQYNCLGFFCGSSGLEWNNGASTLTAANETVSGTLVSNKLDNIFIVDGTHYATTIAGIQAALTDAMAQVAAFAGPVISNPVAKVIVPTGVYGGSCGTGLSLQGVSLEGQGVPVLNFTSCGSTVDYVTITASGTYAEQDRTELKNLNITGDHLGRDGIAINGGQNLLIDGVRVNNYGRDGIHIAPTTNVQYLQDSTIRNVLTWLAPSSLTPGSDTTCASFPNIRDALHIEVTPSGGFPFVNNTHFDNVDLRGYCRRGLYINNATSSGNIAANEFNILEIDGFNVAATTTAAIEFVKSGSAVSGGISSLIFDQLGCEDSFQVHSVPCIIVGPSGFVNGLSMRFPITSNFTPVPSNNSSSAILDFPLNISSLTILTTNDIRTWSSTYPLNGGICVGVNPNGGSCAAGQLQLGGVTFSALPAWANGSQIYCTDCNSTCSAGSSTGRTCFRENGVWVH